MLVWRINKVLEKYRNAASHDLDSGKGTRVSIGSLLTTSNSELYGLAVVSFRERLSESAKTRDKGPMPKIQSRPRDFSREKCSEGRY